MQLPQTTDAPTVEIVNYVDMADLELVAILTPEFSSNTKVRIYSAVRANQVKPGDILYKRDPKTKTSIFYNVITADSIPYPKPKCSVVCMQRPYQLFLRRSRVTIPVLVASMNEELETAIALPY